MLLLDPNVGHTPGQTRSERAAGMIADLRRLGVPAQLRRLEFGDVAFNGWGPDGELPVGIELKTVAGLLGDMVTGRFVGHQVPGMQQAYRYRYLLLEGPVRGSSSDGVLEVPKGSRWWSPSPRMMYVDFLKFIDDIRLRGGFHVLRSWDRMDTLWHVAAEYRGWRKPWAQHKGLKHFNEAQQGVVLMHEPSLLRRWAKELPGVGWEKSEAVERHFRSPLQMAQASVPEWTTIPGVGKTIATRAWKGIRGLR